MVSVFSKHHYGLQGAMRPCRDRTFVIVLGIGAID